MIKRIIFAFLFAFVCNVGLGQYKKEFDNLKHELAIVKEDTSRVLILSKICNRLTFFMQDSAIYYGKQALALSRQIKFTRGEAKTLNNLGFAQEVFNNFPVALKLLLSAEQIAEKNNLPRENANAIHNIGLAYHGMREYSKAIIYLKRSILLYNALNEDGDFIISEIEVGDAFLEMNQLDSALYYFQLAYKHVVERKVNWPTQYILIGLGKIQDKKGNVQLGLDYLHQGLALAYAEENYISTTRFNIEVAKIFFRSKNYDSSLYYANKSLLEAQEGNYLSDIVNACNVLTGVYEKQNPQKALQYTKLASATKDSIYNFEKTNAFKNIIDFDEQETKSAIESAKKDYENKLRQYVFLGGLVILFLIAFILYRNNLREKKAKNQLQEKNNVIEQTLTELKSTQSQLIQSEKMASLGELTAGIAHEIQNPLNFVNNFSDVNKDLLGEMNEEIEKGNLEEVKAIAKDVIDNEEKINHHGKRAESIVKGMLQHSRKSTGIKEATDINALADEYMRLSYHGLRAKDKLFNAEFIMDLDPTLPLVKVIPQDIGRVLLNLFNNAFWAVNEKQHSLNQKSSDHKNQIDNDQAEGPPKSVSDLGGRGKEDGFELVTNHASPTGRLAGSSDTQASSNLQGSSSYQPIVTLSTKNLIDKIEIRIADNGLGIPPHIIDKIFQPFFTTKPTGQGTGLGLSLAYDIIKAHGGELNVKTDVGNGSEFIIQLPTT
jgi:two-component system, NtrC family, sensor kinase